MKPDRDSHSETGHTPEPWDFITKLTASENHKGFAIYDANGAYVGEFSPRDQNGYQGAQTVKRVLSLVNACAGIKNVAAIPQLIEECRGMRNWYAGSLDYRPSYVKKILGALDALGSGEKD